MRAVDPDPIPAAMDASTVCSDTVALDNEEDSEPIWLPRAVDPDPIPAAMDASTVCSDTVAVDNELESDTIWLVRRSVSITVDCAMVD